MIKKINTNNFCWNIQAEKLRAELPWKCYFLLTYVLQIFFRPSDIMALFMCVLRTNLLPSQACSKTVFNHSIKKQALQKNLDQQKRKKKLQLLLSVCGVPAPPWFNATSFLFLLLKGKMNVWGIGWSYQSSLWLKETSSLSGYVLVEKRQGRNGHTSCTEESPGRATIPADFTGNALLKKWQTHF